MLHGLVDFTMFLKADRGCGESEPHIWDLAAAHADLTIISLSSTSTVTAAPRTGNLLRTTPHVVAQYYTGYRIKSSVTSQQVLRIR